MNPQEIKSTIEFYAIKHKQAETRKETDKIDAEVERMLEKEVKNPIARAKYQIIYYLKIDCI